MDLLKALNPSQREAVLHPGGPLLVLAGAGSGKTLVLTRRIAYLLKEIGEDPSSILAITFTNKASGEIKERLHCYLRQFGGKGGRDKGYLLWTGTFHSVGLRILRREHRALGLKRDFSVYDEKDQLALLKECIKWNGDDETLTPEKVLSFIEAMKNDGLLPEDIEPSSHLEERYLYLYRLYQEGLRRNSAVDFGDLILLPIRLFRENPSIHSTYRGRFSHILVDEFQDTNRAQYELIRLLLNGERNLWVVGDDDQSIYGWRGARVKNILDLEKDFPDLKLIRLEQNYRSTRTILGAANSVIRHNTMRRGKTLWTDRKDGERVVLKILNDEKEEALWVGRTILRMAGGKDFGDFAVFYRTNAQSRVIEEAFTRLNIPYEIVGGIGFYERMEIKGLIAYLRVALNPEDSQSLLRVINLPPRGIGKKTLEAAREIAERSSIPLIKGLERGIEEGAFRGRVGEGIRLFLDQVKRLKERLHLSPSQFLEELLSVTGYLKMWEEAGEDSRVENIKEFLSAAKDFEEEREGANISQFIDHLSLVRDIDLYNDGRGKVTLMTIHSAKGLEFPVVFMTGMEEGLFPHSRSIAEGDVEEERRLCYVGMTRAKERLFLSAARERRTFGRTVGQRPSRFLEEIDPAYLVKEDSKEMTFPYGASSGPFSRERSEGLGLLGNDLKGQEEGGLILDFKAGDLVEHKSFGRGKVLGKKGEDILIVSFPGVGLKKLKLSQAPLRKVG